MARSYDADQYEVYEDGTLWRIPDTGNGEDPPDDYYDCYEEETGEVPPGWSDQERADDGGPVVEEVTVLPVGVYDSRGYSMEPPF